MKVTKDIFSTHDNSVFFSNVAKLSNRNQNTVLQGSPVGNLNKNMSLVQLWKIGFE